MPHMAANLINSLISQLKKDMFDNIITKLKIFQKKLTASAVGRLIKML